MGAYEDYQALMRHVRAERRIGTQREAQRQAEERNAKRQADRGKTQ